MTADEFRQSMIQYNAQRTPVVDASAGTVTKKNETLIWNFRMEDAEEYCVLTNGVVTYIVIDRWGQASDVYHGTMAQLLSNDALDLFCCSH